MPRFVHRSRIEAPASNVFEWHKQPGAFERLLPPWERVEVVDRTGGINDGDRVTIRSYVGPLSTQWVIEHRNYVEGAQFQDFQISGPFKQWEHTHRVIPDGPDACYLEDDIVYQLPLGILGKMAGGGLVESKLRRMFNYRHDVTRGDVQAHRAGAGAARMRILVTGSTGLIGANLIPLLTTGGHEVIRLSRRGDGDAVWNIESGAIEVKSSGPIDAVVHLAGENIAGRWTAARKKRILDSRINGTRQVSEWVSKQETPPKVVLTASAIGFYGNRGDEVLTEESIKGDGFLSDVCDQWESASESVNREQTRVAQLRFGVVLSPLGGALSKMLTPFKLGGGGRVGTGRQYWSWVSLDDAAGAILHALQCDDIRGPANVVSPQPATNNAFTKALAKVLKRPAIVPMPAAAARAAFGEMAEELLLASQRVSPDRLQSSNYNFRHPTLEAALRHLLGAPSRE